MAGPEKYREHGSTAPRKGPSCQEGRPNLEEKCPFHGQQWTKRYVSPPPLKLALIFVHMHFAWGLFASVKWAWVELNKTVHSVYVSSAVCTVLYSYLAPPWPQYCQPITEIEVVSICKQKIDVVFQIGFYYIPEWLLGQVLLSYFTTSPGRPAGRLLDISKLRSSSKAWLEAWAELGNYISLNVLNVQNNSHKSSKILAYSWNNALLLDALPKHLYRY